MQFDIQGQMTSKAHNVMPLALEKESNSEQK